MKKVVHAARLATSFVAMRQHPHADDLPAFALGALDAEEAHLVRVHLATCPRCRASVKAYDAVVCLLPYAAPLQRPPERLKWRILASVAGTESDERAEGRLSVSEHTNSAFPQPSAGTS